MYSNKVMDHFSNPRNVGELADANAVGEVGNAKCGDIMKIYMKIEDNIIKNVSFKTFGCGAAIATSSMATELVKGKSIEDALSLSMISQSQWDEYFKDKKHLFDGLYVEVKDDFKGKEYAKYLTITENLFSSESYIRKDTIGLLVNYMITNVVIAENGSGCKSKFLNLEVKLIDDVEELRALLCDIVLKFVILDENVQQLEFKGQKLIIELFQVLAKDPERFLPKSTRVIWKNAKANLPVQEHESAQLRVICDFIAGMTDDYATKFYEKFFTPNKGSIFDRL